MIKEILLATMSEKFTFCSLLLHINIALGSLFKVLVIPEIEVNNFVNGFGQLPTSVTLGKPSDFYKIWFLF